jgi:threonine aldolase
LYEGGGVSANSGVSCTLLDGNRGLITADLVRDAIHDPANIHLPLSKLVSLENTTNKGGGACYDIDEIKKIRTVCDEHNLKLHLDGARIWNALVAKNQNPKDFGALFDSISVCFSKGLGAPVGSVLVSDNETNKNALRMRKLFGGGMRQAGYLAAAGIFALDNNIGRLTEDHRRAKELAAVLQKMDWVEKVEPVETNILIFTTNKDENLVIEKLKERNISIISMGNGKLRMVTHLDYREVMHSYVLETLGRIVF